MMLCDLAIHYLRTVFSLQYNNTDWSDLQADILSLMGYDLDSALCFNTGRVKLDAGIKCLL